MNPYESRDLLPLILPHVPSSEVKFFQLSLVNKHWYSVIRNIHSRYHPRWSLLTGPIKPRFNDSLEKKCLTLSDAELDSELEKHSFMKDEILKHRAHIRLYKSVPDGMIKWTRDYLLYKTNLDPQKSFIISDAIAYINQYKSRFVGDENRYRDIPESDFIFDVLNRLPPIHLDPDHLKSINIQTVFDSFSGYSIRLTPSVLQLIQKYNIKLSHPLIFLPQYTDLYLKHSEYCIHLIRSVRSSTISHDKSYRLQEVNHEIAEGVIKKWLDLKLLTHWTVIVYECTSQQIDREYWPVRIIGDVMNIEAHGFGDNGIRFKDYDYQIWNT